MRIATLSVGLALLAGFSFANPQDFSGGFTNMGSNPVAAAAANPEWNAKQTEAERAAAAALQSAPVSANVAPGQLAPGDKVRMTIFGEEDMSGEFEVDSTGSLAVPLVGEVQAKGLTPREIEKRIADKLNSGYLVNARVNIEVLNFRPFFILGEVQKPGSYPWTNDMTIINAVAVGGGYTPRAKVGNVTLRRANDPTRKEVIVPEETKVYPGDVIRVEERFF